MNTNRLWLLGIAALSIAILALGWFLGISPMLDSAAALQQQKSQVDQQNATAQVRLAKLKSDYKNLDKVAAQLDALRESLPASADYTGFLQELNSIAGQTNVKLGSFIPSAPVTAAQAGQGTAAPTAAPTSAALPDGTLVAIPVTLSVTGSYNAVVDFVGELQAGNRLFLVASLNIAGSGSTFTATVTGTMYVKIDSSIAAPGAAVGETAPTQSPTPTATSTTSG